MRPNQAYSSFRELTYPIRTDELVELIGDTELELPAGTETIGEVFDRLSSETYADPREAYTMFLSGLSAKAIGRKSYSDRDPPVLGLREADPLLEEGTRFDAAGSHCGICRHVELVGDWDVTAYCALRDEIVQPVVDDVCSDFVSSGWDYTGRGTAGDR